MAKFRKATIILVVSVRPSVRMEQLGSDRTNISEIWCLKIFFLWSVEKIISTFLCLCVVHCAWVPSYTVNYTHTHNGSEYAAITPTLSMSTDTIESFLSFLAKHCTSLADDGSSAILNMLEHFYIFYNYNCIYILYTVIPRLTSDLANEFFG